MGHSLGEDLYVIHRCDCAVSIETGKKLTSPFVSLIFGFRTEPKSSIQCIARKLETLLVRKISAEAHEI
jgi:hypothetical protein